MKFNNCRLRNELKEGLLQYERDTNVSPHSIVESLIEKFLYNQGYLGVGFDDKELPSLTELINPRIKHTTVRENGKLLIEKWVDGVHGFYGTCQYDEAKIIVDFLISKNWDLKYATSNTKLKGQKQIDFLFNEIEKENVLKETE